MQILSNTTSPYSRIARIALGEKGFDLAPTQMVNPWGDEKVLVRLSIHATRTGPFGDMKATGKKIEVQVLDLFEFKKGVLVEHWAQLDNLGMMKQLGAIPA